jgi:3D (Asp-Asp-Asp) domain-containing protein
MRYRLPTSGARHAQRVLLSGLLCGLVMLAEVPLALALPLPDAPTTLNLNGRRLGEFKLTYYRLAEADSTKDRPAPGWVPVFGRDCARVLTWVTEVFHSDLGLQGSGVLPDGRLLNFEQRCTCAVPTQRGERICYAELKRTDFPFGRGAQWKQQYFWLQPLRSAAVDPGVVPIGTVMYIPQLDGRTLQHGVGHNGCIRAEDTGRAIQGPHLDLFAGSTRSTPQLPGKLPLGSVTVFVDAKRCTGAFP